MTKGSPYTLIYAADVKSHLKAIDTKHHSQIREKIEEQLLHEPTSETTNRKPLRQPAAYAATWEIRFGPDNRFRVLYAVEEPNRSVHVLAVGEKEGNRLLVGGVEIQP
jgi:mRNA-degrading endonuclease RelE of RelBE toxin-antitoxin system